VQLTDMSIYIEQTDSAAVSSVRLCPLTQLKKLQVWNSSSKSSSASHLFGLWQKHNL